MEFGATAVRFVSTALNALLPRLKQRYAERSAGKSPTEVPLSIADDVLDAALVRLGTLQPDDPIWKRCIVGLEATLVRPELFEMPSVREWLSQPKVRSGLKSAAEASIARSEVSQQVIDRLADEYAEATGEDRRFADHPIRIVIAFLRASVQGLTRDPGMVAIFQAIGSDLSQKIGKVDARVSAMAEMPGLPRNFRLVDLPTALQNASAPLLTWPSTLADGIWLHRPELHSLIESITAQTSSTHFLLGDPGCGKSSLLVRLAHERQTAGWCVLAIKADRLPPDLLDREALAKHLNLDADVSTVLRELAKSERIIVLIDQVDALADLVVQHSARLRVLLELVRDLTDVEGVHTVVSCRTFEQKHDPALRNLDAIAIRLELPEWSAVLPVLTSRGLQAELWNQDIQQVLRSPHALDIFLSLLDGGSEPEVLRSFQGLLERQWQSQVLSDTTGARRATLHHLAKTMADREVLGLPIVQVEDHYENIQALAAAGLLRVSQGPGRVEFRHQTLYEFVRARSFLEDSGSLTEAVRAQQGSLRIRPQLWHALGYFRGASPEEYGSEIGRLWAANLRPHLKMLLIEFLGLQTAPMPAERRLVEQAMTDQWFLPRFIGAAVGSQGWFAVLYSTHLPGMMALPVEQAQALLPMLRQALHFSADEVVDLVRRHWLNRKRAAIPPLKGSF